MARTKSVLLRLSEAEHARLKELAGREPVNAYLRRVAGVEEAQGIASEPRPAAKGSHQVPAAPAPPEFKCPVRGCEFGAASPVARCPNHARLVVPG